MSDWLNKLTGGGEGGGPRKKSQKIIWSLALVCLLGIILIAGLDGDSGQDPAPVRESRVEAGEQTADGTVRKTMMAAEEEALAAKLQSMLERIEGAGSVKVTVRLATSAREAYAINNTTGRKTTVEKDQGGGTRTISENNDATQLVMSKNGKGEAPVVEMESASRVAGVLVVSSGAGSPQVKESLFEAVRVALSVEPHRILVLTGGR